MTAARSGSGAGPLDGLRAVVLTETPTAAYAADLLALLGAEVVHIALDPGADEGIDLLRTLLPSADVVLEDCAARVLAEANLDVGDTRAAHRDVVWCALAGVEGEERADVSAAWHAVAAVLLALHHRAAGSHSSGRAQRIDLDVAASRTPAFVAAPPPALPLRFTFARTP